MIKINVLNGLKNITNEADDILNYKDENPPNYNDTVNRGGFSP